MWRISKLALGSFTVLSITGFFIVKFVTERELFSIERITYSSVEDSCWLTDKDFYKLCVPPSFSKMSVNVYH
jgi:hypothetical protein